MKKSMKKGFTLIEIALFLAVTGMLFVGIVAGVQNSMFQQRYNDAVQSFAEFLRTVYSQTLNVENAREKGGQDTSWAIYGKLVTFGESSGFNGSNDENAIFSYTVVGKIDNGGFGSAKDVLTEFKNRDLSVTIDEGEGVAFAGIAEQYFPRWGSRIETTRGWQNGYQDFKGAILVVRHPRSGAVYTYILENNTTVEINQGESLSKYFPDEDDDDNSSGKFHIIGDDGIDFCVDPNGGVKQGERRDIRINSGAVNASGIEIIPQDEGNQCQK